MTLLEVFTIIIIHWIADFVFQDEKWALGKSKNNFDLTAHTTVYSVLWYLPMCIMLNNFLLPLLFIITTFITHTLTDYFTSRIVSRKFERKEYGSNIPNFGAFTVIGFDQVLHYIQLFTTYYILIKLP
jgi:hypothetical protein